jgi:hypothetical protein
MADSCGNTCRCRGLESLACGGNPLGNHTWSHRNLNEQSPRTIRGRRHVALVLALVISGSVTVVILAYREEAFEIVARPVEAKSREQARRPIAVNKRVDVNELKLRNAGHPNLFASLFEAKRQSRPSSAGLRAEAAECIPSLPRASSRCNFEFCDILRAKLCFLVRLERGACEFAESELP